MTIYSKIWLICLVGLSTTIWAEEVSRTETIAGDYPYGIRIEENWTEAKDGQSEHDTITFYQNGKRIDRVDTFRAYPLYYTDLDGDGKKEVIFKIFDGRREFDWVIVKIAPNMPKPIRFENMAELSLLSKRDKKPVLESVEEGYGSIYSGQSAYAWVYADFDGTRFHLIRASQKKAFERLKKSYGDVSVFLDEEGFLETSDPREMTKIVTYAVHAWYAGENEKAMTLITRRVHPVDQATLYLFIQDLVQELSHSHYWNDIKIFNNWEENGYVVLEENDSDRDHTLEKGAIVRSLFIQALKHGFTPAEKQKKSRISRILDHALHTYK